VVALANKSKDDIAQAFNELGCVMENQDAKSIIERVRYDINP
jgi:hypothetical protein